MAGVFWISYTQQAAKAIHLTAALIGLVAMLITGVSIRQLRAELASLLAAILAAATTGALLGVFRPMAVFGAAWLAILLYTPIALLAGIHAREAVLSSLPLPPAVSTTTTSSSIAAIIDQTSR